MAAGSIVVDLLAKTGSFITDMDRAAKAGEKSFNKLKNSSKGMAAGITGDFDQLGHLAAMATEKIKAMLTPLALGAAAIAGVGVAMNKMVGAQRQFDVLNASLITVSGSAEQAKKNFDWLSEFAATTPYDLEQAVNAFVKLKSLGLDASLPSLKSFGNTAAAMGKELSQFIDAVSSASVGNFRQLKEFGIIARSEGNKLSMTFQGVTTKIGKNSAEIQKYLTDIGNNQFAGAMEERAKTLDGALANLGDTFGSFWLTLSQSGFGVFFADQVRSATDALDDIIAVIKVLNDDMGELNEKTGESAKKTGEVTSLLSPFRDKLIDVAMVADFVAAQIATLVSAMVALAKASWALINLNFGDAKNAMTGYFDAAEKRWKAVEERAVRLQSRRFAGGVELTDDAKARLAALDDTGKSPGGIDLGDGKRKGRRGKSELDRMMEEGKRIYDQTRTAAEKYSIEIERLDKLRSVGAIGQETYNRAIEKSKKTFDDATAAEKRARERLYDGLRSEEQEVTLSYERRKDAINKATLDSEEERVRLLGLAAKKYDEDVQKRVDSLLGGLLSEEEEIRKSYERRRKLIEESGFIPDGEKQGWLAGLAKERDSKLTALDDSLYAGLLPPEDELRRALARRLAMIEKETQGSIEKRQELEFLARKKFYEEKYELDKNKMDEWVDAVKERVGEFESVLASATEKITSGFGSAFESMIFDAESLGDALHNLFDGVARSMVNAMATMAAEWALLQVMQENFGKNAKTKAEIDAAKTQVSNASIASMQAGLNAYASAAAVPMTGWLAAPAAMAEAIAATAPLAASIAGLATAAVGARAFGGPVSENMPYLVGERGAELFVPNTSGAIVPNSKLGGGQQIVNVIEDSRRAGQTVRRTNNGRQEVDVFVADIMGDGQRAKALQRAFGLTRKGY